MSTVVINDELFTKIEASLARISLFNRSPALIKGMGSVGDKVKNRTFEKIQPEPGYPGDVVGKIPLRKTLARRVIQWESGKVTVLVKFVYNKGAKHAHLVEHGHIVKPNKHRPRRRKPGHKIPGTLVYNKPGMGGRTEAKKYITNAGIETRSQQRIALEKSVIRSLAKEGT